MRLGICDDPAEKEERGPDRFCATNGKSGAVMRWSRQPFRLENLAQRYESVRDFRNDPVDVLLQHSAVPR
jgi:hypothetical protein